MSRMPSNRDATAKAATTPDAVPQSRPEALAKGTQSHQAGARAFRSMKLRKASPRPQVQPRTSLTGSESMNLITTEEEPEQCKPGGPLFVRDREQEEEIKQLVADLQKNGSRDEKEIVNLLIKSNLLGRRFFAQEVERSRQDKNRFEVDIKYFTEWFQRREQEMQPKYEYFYAPYAQSAKDREQMMRNIAGRRLKYKRESMKSSSPLRDLDGVALGSELRLEQELSSPWPMKDKFEKSPRSSLSPHKLKSDRKSLGPGGRLSVHAR